MKQNKQNNKLTPVLPSADEVQSIKKGNVELINKYYLVNYELICKKARFYARAVERFSDWQDFANDVYLNFPKLDFSCNASFYTTLKYSFSWSRCGGKHVVDQLQRKNAIQQEIYVLDAPVKNAPHEWRDMTIGEAIESDFDILNEICPRADFSEKVYNLLLPYCTKGEKQIFELRYWVEYSFRELAKMFGKKSVSPSYLARFRKHADEIKARLVEMGFYEDNAVAS